MIGNPHENIDDFMETLSFWFDNSVTINPFICTPYVGSPIFYDNQDYLLQQYDSKLKMIADGRTSQEIADILVISVKTVLGHRAKVMEKLDIHNRTELIKYAMRKGLVNLDT